MSPDDEMWQPPGPGQWFYSAEHLPGAVSTLFAELLPAATQGWAWGAERYGLPPRRATFGAVGRFLYYSPGDPGPVDQGQLERTAREVLETERWQRDLRTWAEVTRPAVVAESRALVAVDLEALDDQALSDHVAEAAAHFVRWAPEHFTLMPVGACAGGAFIGAATGWGLDPGEAFEALAGAAGATSSGDSLLARITAGLRDAGIAEVTDLTEVMAVGGDAAAALDELLVDYGWRALGHDLTPTLAEAPDALVAMVNAALEVCGPRSRPDPGRLAALRSRVPDAERHRFDALAAVARVAYGFNDDNTVVLFSMPLGIVRRAVLEVGRRLAKRERLVDEADAFEATIAELRALLDGAGPAADVLARRRAEREEAAQLDPPLAIGEPGPPDEPGELPEPTRRLAALVDGWWAAGGGSPTPDRAAATVGAEVARGRALVAHDPIDALLRLEPGDVLVTDTTHAAWNVVFPVVAAIAVEHGGPMGHAAILARELGVTAVIGVPGLLDRVRDGDQVEIDPTAGTITVIEAATREPRR